MEVVGGRAEHLEISLDLLAGAGSTVTVTPDGFRVVGPQGRPRSVDVATLPYPGFPTDLQPFALTYNAVADGSAMITENLFEARFRTVQELARLGADARIDGHHVMVHGVPLLSGAPVEASDIRAGAALVVAGLVADGVTDGERRAPRRPGVRPVRAAAPGAGRRRRPRARRRPLRLSRSTGSSRIRHRQRACHGVCP